MMRKAKFWLPWLCLLLLGAIAAVNGTAANSGLLEAAAAPTQTVQLKNDNGRGTIYTTQARTCWSFATVVGGGAAQYPLRILSVETLLYRGFTGAAATAQVSAVVFSIGADGHPGALLARSP